MGHQIIRQPDGKLAVFSSVTDTIVMYSADAAEVEAYFLTREVRNTIVEIHRIMRHVEAGTPERVYHQFAMSWEEALQTDREHGGKVWKRVTG